MLQRFFSLILILSTLGGCVSINLANEGVERVNNIDLKSPPSPFVEINLIGSQKAWRSSETGSVISFYSECGKNVSSDIDADLDSVTDNLTAATVISREMSPDKGRIIAKGLNNGISAQIDVSVRKNKKCEVILSRSALDSLFEKEKLVYEKWLSEVEWP